MASLPSATVCSSTTLCCSIFFGHFQHAIAVINYYSYCYYLQASLKQPRWCHWPPVTSVPPDIVAPTCSVLLSLPVELWISHFSKMYKVSVCGTGEGFDGNAESEWYQMLLFPETRETIIFDPKYSLFDSSLPCET